MAKTKPFQREREKSPNGDSPSRAMTAHRNSPIPEKDSRLQTVPTTVNYKTSRSCLNLMTADIEAPSSAPSKQAPKTSSNVQRKATAGFNKNDPNIVTISERLMRNSDTNNSALGGRVPTVSNKLGQGDDVSASRKSGAYHEPGSSRTATDRGVERRRLVEASVSQRNHRYDSAALEDTGSERSLILQDIPQVFSDGPALGSLSVTSTLSLFHVSSSAHSMSTDKGIVKPSQSPTCSTAELPGDYCVSAAANPALKSGVQKGGTSVGLKHKVGNEHRRHRSHPGEKSPLRDTILRYKGIASDQTGPGQTRRTFEVKSCTSNERKEMCHRSVPDSASADDTRSLNEDERSENLAPSLYRRHHSLVNVYSSISGDCFNSFSARSERS